MGIGKGEGVVGLDFYGGVDIGATGEEIGDIEGVGFGVYIDIGMGVGIEIAVIVDVGIKAGIEVVVGDVGVVLGVLIVVLFCTYDVIVEEVGVFV